MTDVSHNRKLFTFSSGGWVILISACLCAVAALLVLRPVFETGFRQAIGDGQNVSTYGFDLTHLTIPREKLIAAGVPKDGIRAISSVLVETIRPEEVDLIAANEHIRFLVPTDRVIGVDLNGEARTYPVRVLALHEAVNDTVSGVPLCVSYSPLCDSIVVFDRRIDGPNDPPSEFGVSGLLVNSNLVLYDRRKRAEEESLWSQLGLTAISGPKAGEKVKLIPYELTTWSAWRTQHPKTRVLLGLRTLKLEYGSEPYNTYFADDQLRFPVDPLWNDPKIRKKTRIIASSSNGVQWTVHPDLTLPPDTIEPAKPDPFHIHSFVFAWYAFHSDDTDFSAIQR